MAVPNADDLADALLKMASGEITLDDEPGNSAFGETLIEPAPAIPPAMPAAPARSAAPGGSSAVEDSAPSARPARPAAPARRPAVSPEMLPLPPMPGTIPSPMVAEAMDEPAARPMIAGFDPAAGSLAPEADLAALARAGDVFQPAGRVVRQPVYQSDEFRRTLIPVLGVSGILLFVLASSCYFVRPESPLTGLPPWMPPVLFLAGAVLLVLAVLNMMSVRASRAARQ